MTHPASIWTEPDNKDLGLGRLIAEYIVYLEGRSEATAAGTVVKYRASLVSLRQSIQRHGDPDALASITPFAVNQWVAAQRKAGRSEQGIASRLSAVKVFTNRYLHNYLELTNADLLRKVPRSAAPDKPVQGLGPEEVEQVLESLDGFRFEDIRNRAFVMLLLATGLRLREGTQLKLGEVDKLSGEITVHGKGNRMRTARLGQRSLKSLRDYVKLRPAGQADDPLWLTGEGTAFTYWAAQSLFRRLKGRCGIERIRAHLLRHTFAQTALLKGAERSAVQDMLGHTTDAMTRRYAGEVRQRLAAQQMPAFAPV